MATQLSWVTESQCDPWHLPLTLLAHCHSDHSVFFFPIFLIITVMGLNAFNCSPFSTNGGRVRPRLSCWAASLGPLSLPLACWSHLVWPC